MFAGTGAVGRIGRPGLSAKHGASLLSGMTLALDFMNDGVLDPRITFMRASSATYTDASGIIQIAAINQPRWDYASGVLRGLLVEGPGTNLLLNSTTLVTQSITVIAQAYTLSFYGTGTITKSGAATGALVGTGVGQRVTQTFTPTAGTLTCTVTGSVTNAQIEASSFVTSWIPTAGATATREIDYAIMPIAGWYNQNAGTALTTFTNRAWAGAAVLNNALFVFDDGTSNNTIYQMAFANSNTFVQPNAAVVYLGTPANVSYNNLDIGGAPYTKAALAWASGGTLRQAANGGVVSSVAMGNAPVVSRLVFNGQLYGLVALNGHLRQFIYWNRALSDAELPQVTT